MVSGITSDTLVIQSHTEPLPFAWLEDCIDSVNSWAAGHAFDYRWIGDECFAALPDDLRQKTRQQIVVASDLARLYAIRQALQDGYRCVVWCDADFLVIDPQALLLPASPFAFGREVWIELDSRQKNRARVKVHNAFMQFRHDNSFLPFYIDSAERLLRQHKAGMPPQFIGPKLLTALHNMLHFAVVETAGMLSPLVAADIDQGGGAALELFLRDHQQIPAGLNLSASVVDQYASMSLEIPTLIERLRTGLPPERA